MSFTWILIDFSVVFRFSEILQLQGMTFVDRFMFFGGFCRQRGRLAMEGERCGGAGDRGAKIVQLMNADWLRVI